MEVYSKTRPSKADFGIAEGSFKFFRIVNLGNCRWSAVSVKGAPGTMRQNPRQSSSKKMRNGRKTAAAKDRIAARLEKHFNPSAMKEAEKVAECLGKSRMEIWREFL